MSRAFSSATLQAMYSQETGDGPLVLLTITHPLLATPIRICSDAKDQTSGGDTYIAFPFTIQLPDQTSDQPPSGNISVDNVDRSIVAAFRALGSNPATLTFELATLLAPDTVEITQQFLMTQMSWDALTVSASLGFEDDLSEPSPGNQVDPSTIPGVFV